MNRNRTLLILSVTILICLEAAAVSLAQEKATLDEIIRLFDNEETQSSDGAMEELLEGFDDKEGAVKKGTDMEEILDGFKEDEQEVKTSAPEKRYLPSFMSLDGFFSVGSTYNFAHDKPEPGETDWRGLSMLRPELQLELEMRFSDTWRAYIEGRGLYDFVYMIKGRYQFTDQVLDNYEKELEFREVFLQGSLGSSLDLKLGRQIVVWGKSDNIRVTDVLNPLDLRVPGITDIENLKLPVTMVKLDYYIGNWDLSGIAIPEIRFSKVPVSGSDFFPSPVPLPLEVTPKESLENTQWAAALSGIFSGWDLAFYWADIFQDLPHAELAEIGPPLQLELKYARMTMWGSAFNVALGNWLLKCESAHFEGIKFFGAPENEFSRTDILVGAEYSGFAETFLGLEVVNRHVHDFDEIFKQTPDEAVEDEFQWVVRVSRDFLNDTLTMTLLASTYGVTGEDGAFQRLQAEYDYTDNIEITGGVVLYHSGDLPRFRNIGGNDRVFLEVQYNF